MKGGRGARGGLSIAMVLAFALIPVRGSASGADGTVDRFAGGGFGHGLPALDAPLVVQKVARGTHHLYFTSSGPPRIGRVDLRTGRLEILLGNGAAVSAGDGGCARAASLEIPFSITVDSRDLEHEVVYFGDIFRIRRILPATEDSCAIVETVAGSGEDCRLVEGSCWSDGPALEMRLVYPYGLAVAPDGTLYFAEGRHVRKLADGSVSTIAGTGEDGSAGDGGPALEATLRWPVSLAFDRQGRLLVSDEVANNLRRIDLESGIIESVPGGQGFGGIDVDEEGNIYGATVRFFENPDLQPGSIVRVDPQGSRTNIAGLGFIVADFATGLPYHEGAPAGVVLLGPRDVKIDGGDLLFVDGWNRMSIKRVSGFVSGATDETGFVNTVAGRRGSCSAQGDGGDRLSASLCGPWDITSGPDGSFVVTERYNFRVRQIAADGTVSTIAGGETCADSGDFGRARDALLCWPYYSSYDPGSESLYIADGGNSRVRVIGADGIIRPFAGTGVVGYAGDGGPAAAALLNVPTQMAIDGRGNIYIADTGNNAVRKVDRLGIITTVAGGQPGFCCDGGPATRARLSAPVGLAVTPDGDLLIAESSGNRIRRVDSDGIITTIAGDGLCGDDPNNGPPLEADLCNPNGIRLGANGDLYIAETNRAMIRRLEDWDPATGRFERITTVAGSGHNGWDGDGGPALDAAFREIRGVALDANGGVLIADSANDVIRIVYGVTRS